MKWQKHNHNTGLTRIPYAPCHGVIDGYMSVGEGDLVKCLRKLKQNASIPTESVLVSTKI